jgi:hypothetical protein
VAASRGRKRRFRPLRLVKGSGAGPRKENRRTVEGRLLYANLTFEHRDCDLVALLQRAYGTQCRDPGQITMRSAEGTRIIEKQLCHLAVETGSFRALFWPNGPDETQALVEANGDLARRCGRVWNLVRRQAKQYKPQLTRAEIKTSGLEDESCASGTTSGWRRSICRDNVVAFLLFGATLGVMLGGIFSFAYERKTDLVIGSLPTLIGAGAILLNSLADILLKRILWEIRVA